MKKLQLVIILFIFSWSATAQLCFRKYQKEGCKTYLVTEVSLNYPIPVSLSNKNIERHWDTSSNIGVMYDLNQKIGIGGHFFGGFYMNGGGHTQYGIRARGSYYFKNDLQLNFSPGVILYDSPFPDGFAGYSLELNFSWNDHLGISLRYDDLVKDRFRKEESYLNLGIQTDGKKGLIIAAAGLLTGVIRNYLKQN